MTAQTIGAQITSATATNRLDLSGGGTAAMAAPMTGIAKVAIDGINVSGTTFTANATEALPITGGVGIDTIIFCAVGQSVAMGCRTTLIKGVMGDASNLVTTTGATTLELTTGGGGTLNAGDSDITVKLDAASNLGSPRRRSSQLSAPQQGRTG